MFSTKDVAEYYDTTQVHYESWWNLKKNLSLHYGIWDETTKDFNESLVNTNKTLLKKSGITGNDKVLDAGCGVGGAAFFVHASTGATVTGISLSTKQVKLAKSTAIEKGVTDSVDFKIMDFTKTDFPDETFDVVWACESVCHAVDKKDFIKEAYRVLKKGGRLIMSDFFKAKADQEDKNDWINKWGDTWGVPNFATTALFEQGVKESGFQSVEILDYTDKIQKSAKRLYYTSLLGVVPSELYNLFNPSVSRFAKTHYKCGYYQYKGLQEKLWTYNVVFAVK